MNSQLFLIINLVVALLFVIWYVRGRSAERRSTSLDMKKGNPFSPSEGPTQENLLKTAEKILAEKKPIGPVEPPKAEEPKAKNLNVIFMYNGRDWDAYEVLGLPAGASLTLVTAKYQELIRTEDPGKLSFLEHAYNAILKKE